MDAEVKNLQAALQRTKELRQELANEKAKTSSYNSKMNQLQQEIQLRQSNFQQNYEQHRLEIKNAQTQIQQLNIKVNEEKAISQKLHEENGKLQQILQ